MVELDLISEFAPKISWAFLQTIINSVLIFGIGTSMAILHQTVSVQVTPNWIATVWSFWWRAVPEVSVIVLLYYGVRWPLSDLGPQGVGVLVLSLVASAYVSAIISTALEQIDASQMESARALGLNQFHTNLLIIWPQILKNIRYPMAMYYADVVKQSSLLSVIGVYGATMEAYRLGAETFHYLEALLLVAAFFFVYISAIEQLAHRLKAGNKKKTREVIWWMKR